jgi:serine phosphatase RsbU (regulator of sigma subunit)
VDLDLETGQMMAASAGHPSQVLVQGNNLNWIRPKGLIVGLSEDSVYENSILTLQPDSTFFLYTDGLYESHYRVSTDEPIPPMNPEMAGDAFFDASGRGSAREAAENLVNHFYEREIDIAPEDDITLIVCRYLPSKVTNGTRKSGVRQEAL